MANSYTYKVTDLSSGRSIIGTAAIGEYFGYCKEYASILCKEGRSNINGVPVRIEKIPVKKRVRCMERGQNFESCEAAAKAFGISQSAICRSINHGAKAKGYHWRYVS